MTRSFSFSSLNEVSGRLSCEKSGIFRSSKELPDSEGVSVTGEVWDEMRGCAGEREGKTTGREALGLDEVPPKYEEEEYDGKVGGGTKSKVPSAGACDAIEDATA